MPAYDITGQKFARWTVLCLHHIKDPHKYYICRCECGTERVVQGNSLRTGTSKSCGCLIGDSARERFTTHKMSKHPAYSNWLSMHKRCRVYPSYLRHGIVVCADWATFEGFWKDMGPSWKAGLTVERNNVAGNYEKANCRWLPQSEQPSNRHDTIWVDTTQGRMSLAKACRLYGVNYSSAQNRRLRGLPQSEWFR